MLGNPPCGSSYFQRLPPSLVVVVVMLGCAALFLQAILWVLTGSALLSLLSPYLRDASLHGKTRKASGTVKILGLQLSSVRKARFSHFYAFGLSVNLVAMWLVLAASERVFLGGCSADSRASDVTLALSLLQIHLMRRFAECLLVHNWGESQMSLEAYAVGLLHYALVSLTFLSAVDPNLKDADWGLRQVLGSALSILAQVLQHHCHTHLASLKKGGSEMYTLPRSLLFQYSCCPHYLAEIIIYASLMIVAGSRSSVMWALMSWVTVNLSISANNTHTWYLHNFKCYGCRRRLIPGLW
jgi:3-oxo-5-alpha-steroid 4-dehydrogenase 3